MALAWSAVLAAMFWVVVAAGASFVVGSVQALIGLAVAVMVHGAICWVMSKTAAETGLTVGLFSRSMFGYRGASIATFVFAVTGTWFAVFEGSVLAVAAQAQFGGPIQLWYLIVTACAIPLVLGGVRVWLEKVNAYLLPIFAVGLIAAVIWATTEFGYHSQWLTFTPVDAHPDGWSGVAVRVRDLHGRVLQHAVHVRLRPHGTHQRTPRSTASTPSGSRSTSSRSWSTAPSVSTSPTPSRWQAGSPRPAWSSGSSR